MPPQPQRGGPRQRILPTPRGVNMIVWSLDNRFVLAAIMGELVLFLSPILLLSFPFFFFLKKCLGAASFAMQYATHTEKVSKTTKMLE